MSVPWCSCCGDSFASSRLCRECKADPANAGWREASVHETELFEPDSIPSGGHRLADYQGSPLPSITDKQKQILGLIAYYGIKYPVMKRVRRNGIRVWIPTEAWTSKALEAEEIAWLVGCHRNYVLTVYQRMVS